MTTQRCNGKRGRGTLFDYWGWDFDFWAKSFDGWVDYYQMNTKSGESGESGETGSPKVGKTERKYKYK